MYPIYHDFNIQKLNKFKFRLFFVFKIVFYNFVSQFCV